MLSLINLLWDRGEGDGWAHHVTTDPPAGTPAHRVLMHAAVGDFQVTTYQADVLARTIGASVHKPAFLPGRSLERVPTFRIPAMTNPFAGSALVYWDNGPVRPDGSTGNGPTPFANTPPREGKDPHGAPRNTPAARRPEVAVPAHRQRGRRVRRRALHVGLHEALGNEVAAAEGRHPDRGQRRGHR